MPYPGIAVGGVGVTALVGAMILPADVAKGSKSTGAGDGAGNGAANGGKGEVANGDGGTVEEEVLPCRCATGAGTGGSGLWDAKGSVSQGSSNPPRRLPTAGPCAGVLEVNAACGTGDAEKPGPGVGVNDGAGAAIGA